MKLRRNIAAVACLLSLGAIAAITAIQTHFRSSNVYLAARADGLSGSGSKVDPFDASTAAKLAGILRKLRNKVHIIFAAGTYQINVADVINGGFVKSGWNVRGAGEYLTTIQLAGSLAGVNYVYILSSPQHVFTSNVSVSDLTVDCNWPKLANTAATGRVVRKFAGKVAKQSAVVSGSAFTPNDIGQLIEGPGVPRETWVGSIIDSEHAMLSSSATAQGPIEAISDANGNYTIASKKGAVHGLGIGGSNNRLERVRVINSYGSYVNGNECFALGLGGTDYGGVQKPGRNNWIVNCDAESPWGTYANPFAASNTSASGVVRCRAVGINDGYDGRGWTSGGVNGATLKDFAVRDCQFIDTYGVFYIDTGSVDGLTIVSNTTLRGKIGCAIVNPSIKRNISIVRNNFNLQNRGAEYPTAAIQFLYPPAASNVRIKGNTITFDHTGHGVDYFRTLQASSESLGANARVEDNIGPSSLASMGDPHGTYRNNRDVHGVPWFGVR